MLAVTDPRRPDLDALREWAEQFDAETKATILRLIDYADDLERAYTHESDLADRLSAQLGMMAPVNGARMSRTRGRTSWEERT